jgi:hypothetical protein
MSFSFLKISKSPDDQVLKLLTNNVIGTPGKSMLYQHLGVLNKIHNIADPYFVSLQKRNTTLGTCCFCNRSTFNANKPFRSFYIRYFSFADKFRREKISNKITSGISLLREEIKLLLGGRGLDCTDREAFFHYAYVDPRNVRSDALCKEFGFEKVREYATVLFNRISPDANEILVSEISLEDQSKIREMVRQFYHNFTMFSFENLFGQQKYFVVKDNDGNILVGAQANPDHWKVLSWPGLSGKIILPLFSTIPFLNRIFSRNYKFITLEGIFYTPGSERFLEVLFESLLKKFNVNTAIIVVDADSDVYRTLKSLDLGLVDKLNKEVRGEVICRFENFDDAEKKVFKVNPAYISGIDVT